MTLGAKDADEALRPLAFHPTIDVPFTDIVTPDVDKRRLAASATGPDGPAHGPLSARRRRPRSPPKAVVQDAVQDAFLDAGIDLLTKPVTVDELASKRREVPGRR